MLTYNTNNPVVPENGATGFIGYIGVECQITGLRYWNYLVNVTLALAEEADLTVDTALVPFLRIWFPVLIFNVLRPEASADIELTFSVVPAFVIVSGNTGIFWFFTYMP